MLRSRWLLAPLLLLMAACGTGAPAGPSSTSAPDLPEGSEPVELDPADFTTSIDHPYWPMTPGTRWTYREMDEEGRELIVVVTVSSETREIANGLTGVVVRDTVTLDGALIEDTVDWYAQDAAGNVWYLGEETAEYEDGDVSTTAGSWEAGVDGALPGIIMPADPVDGMRYRQEYYEGEAEDNGEILSTEEWAEVPAGQYDDCVLTKDTITIEPDVLEYKLYCRDVGPTLVFGVSGGAGREELMSMETVDEEAARLAGTAPLGEEYP